MKNIFDKQVTEALKERLNKIQPDSQASWGKMNPAQMFAHCNVTYDMDFNDAHPKAKGLKKLMMKWFVKNLVVNEKPYTKNNRTAPEFLITDKRDFDKEKSKLISYMDKTVELGENFFNNRESKNFGRLTKEEYNNMFYKHLDHHFQQFGV